MRTFMTIRRSGRPKTSPELHATKVAVPPASATASPLGERIRRRAERRSSVRELP